MNYKDWILNKAEEISLEKTGKELHTLGPHLEVMCWMVAEEAYTDYIANLINSTYERIRDLQLLG